MKRYLKGLGLSLIAAFALSAVTASAAPAANHHFLVEEGKKIELASEAVTPQKIEPVAGSEEGYECKELSIKEGSTEGTATSLTIEPLYGKCTTFPSGATAEILQNGCDWLLTGQTTKGNPTGGEHASKHITCPAGKAIEIKVTAFKLKCTRIEAQEVKDSVRYTNEETPLTKKTHVRVVTTAHSTKSTTEGTCGEGTHTEGSVTGDLTVTGRNGENVSINTTP